MSAEGNAWEVYFKTQCDFTLLPSAGRRERGRSRKSGGSGVSHVYPLQTSLYNLRKEPASMFNMTVWDLCGRTIRFRHTHRAMLPLDVMSLRFPDFSQDTDLMEKFLITTQVHYWFRFSPGLNKNQFHQSGLFSSSEKVHIHSRWCPNVSQSIFQTQPDMLQSYVLHSDLLMFPRVKCFCVLMSAGTCLVFTLCCIKANMGAVLQKLMAHFRRAQFKEEHTNITNSSQMCSYN